MLPRKSSDLKIQQGYLDNLHFFCSFVSFKLVRSVTV